MNVLAEALKPEFTDRFERLTLSAPRSLAIQVNRNAQSAPQAFGYLIRACNAGLARSAVEGDERDDVERSDTWVFAAMRGKVDFVNRNLGGSQQSVRNAWETARDCKYGAVVVAVTGLIEESYIRDLERLANPF